MDDLLRSRMLAKQQHPDTHPDADSFAALGEGTLRKSERDSLLAHLARCPQCRQVVALASSIQPAKAEMAARPARTFEWKISRWAVVPSVCLLALLLVHRPRHEEASIPLPGLAPPVPVTAPATVHKLKPPAVLKTNRSATPQNVIAPESSPSEQAASPQAAQVPQIQSLTSRRFAFQPQSRYIENRVLMTSAAPQRAASRKDVWVASAEGKLFHSLDNGLHWNPVAVTDAGVALTGAITRIDASNELNVELDTSSGEHWVSNDEGLHWHRR